MSTTVSNKIRIFEFVMSVLIILVHSLSNIEICNIFISKYVHTIPVTPFFIFSGYFMLKGVKDMREIVSRINKRIYTLFIPYIVWNIIYYILYILLKPGTPLNLEILWEAAINYRFNPAFWFINQLIILTLLSPVFFYILKKKTNVIIAYIILAFLIVNGVKIPYINIDSILYYLTGCVIVKYLNQYFIRVKNIQYVIVFLIFTIGAYLMSLGFTALSPYSIYAYNAILLTNIIYRICLIFFVFYGLDFIINYKKVPRFMDHTFFIYAIHYIIIRLINLLVHLIVMPIHNDTIVLVIELVIFISSPVFVIYIANILYDFLNKKIPKKLKYLTGGR